MQSTIVRANQAYTQFIHSEAGGGFNGEIFVVGDHLGGLLLYESLKKISVHLPVSRHSSSISANSRAIPEDCEQEVSLSFSLLLTTCTFDSPLLPTLVLLLSCGREESNGVGGKVC